MSYYCAAGTTNDNPLKIIIGEVSMMYIAEI